MARPLAWADSHIDATFTVTGGGFVADLLLGLAANDTITVIRLIIHLMAVPQNLSDNIDGGSIVTAVIGVSASEAFVANVLPDPGTPTEVPARGWLWKDRIIAVGNSVTGPPAHDVYYGTELKADIRAMRKVDRGNLYLTMQSNNMAVSGSFLPISVSGIVRALCAT